MDGVELESPSYIQWAPDGSRLGKLVTLLGISGYGGQKDNGVIRDSTLFTPVSVFLAWRELETRSGAIVPHLPELLEGCDMHWSYIAHDTQWNPLEAVRELLEATDFHRKGSYDPSQNATTPRTLAQSIYPPERAIPDTNLPITEERGEHRTTNKGSHTSSSAREPSAFSNNPHKRRRRRLSNPHPIDETDLHPFAIIGAFTSRVSETLATIGGALGLPQISGSSTSEKLSQAPLFARTIVTDDATAEAFIHYMKHLGVSHLANIYVKDTFGVSFHVSLQNYANAAGIKLKGFAYNVGEEQDTLRDLIESQYYIVMATIVEWESLFTAAHQANVMGVPEYAWFTPEHYYFTRPSFELSKETNSDLALALSGIGLINVYIKPQPRFEQALDDFVRNKTLQQEFIALQSQPAIFDNYTFQPTTPQPDEYLFFDGALALGLASCRAKGLFNGKELFAQLLQMEFQGLSGKVSFDELGNRGFDGSTYRIDNVRISQSRSDSSFYRFESSLVAELTGNNVSEISPFLFNLGENQYTTAMPSAIPPLEENFNYIPQWAKTLGYCLGSSIMLLSLLILAWVWRRRESYVIKAAQPPFLALLCFGTFVYSSSVFPLSFYGGGPDEKINPRKYNVACMATLWLLFLGFVVSFSAVAAKTYRLNKLMNAGKRIIRVQIKPLDVMKPFFTLLTVNLIALIAITLFAPIEFRRTQVNDYDVFGRSLESYGACRASNSKLLMAFWIPVVTANSVFVALAGKQCYKALEIPMDFSEARFLGISMASLTETIILSSPVLFVLKDQPTGFYIFGAIAVCFLCLSFLVPVFLPKWIYRRKRANMGRAQTIMIAPAKKRTRSSGISSLHSAGAGHVSGMAEDAGSDDEAESRSICSASTVGMMKIHRHNNR